MFSKSKTSVSIEAYWDSVRQAAGLIQNADHVLVGIGSGVTAAGGLCYTDPALVKKWYPEYFAVGKKSILDIMSDFWPTTISESNATAFWGFWANHIYHIRYEPEALQPYRNLFLLMEGKRFFIVTTNVDSQLEKAGFDSNDVFSPQGDYALFQCSTPCCQVVYDNKAQIFAMIGNMASPNEIHAEDIPRCPRCGSFLIPNLRCDSNFIEAPHLRNLKQYEGFLNEAISGNIVLMELGVGYNTPGIIRYPFEAIATNYPNARLIRVNRNDAAFTYGASENCIGVKADVKEFLSDIQSIVL